MRKDLNAKDAKGKTLEIANIQPLCALGVFLFALFAFNHPLNDWNLK